MNSTFGEKIKEARKLKGFTQKQLAAKIGAKHNSVSDWENNKNKPDPDTIELLCGVLDITPNYLLATEAGEFSPTEKLLIEKYRALDLTGREHVDTILKWETERVFQQTLKLENEKYADEVPVYILNYYQRLASAGSGEYLFDNIPTDTIEVPITSTSEQADFVIGVNGRSMEPTYCDGDKVYVKITDEIPIGSIGVFTRGNECFIKELGVNCLKSHNHAGGYDDIPAGEDIRLVGEVLGKIEED